MEGLRGYLEALKAKKTEIESQDIEAFVQAKLLEIEPKIRAEAKAQQQVETPEAISLTARTTHSFFKTAKHCDERICCVNGVGSYNSKSIYSIVHEAEIAGAIPTLFSSPIFLSMSDNNFVMLNLTMAYNNTTNYCQISTRAKNLM